ncbi:pectate lyase family protein [Luteimicrobium sp. DT211]|uniref:pectate lyase family protein n=1 Tax=Luteimicrobium sp. DT211 TaxID=3393412 RepID=UPI003CF9EAF8
MRRTPLPRTAARRAAAVGLAVAAAVALAAGPSSAGSPAAPTAARWLGAADGWAATNGGTVGGADAPRESYYVVSSRAELIAAAANGGHPDDPKVIMVRGTIDGNEAADGHLLGEQDYAPGYDIEKYMSCFADGTTWSDTTFPYCKEQRQLRTTGSNKEKAQIQITLPSNTSLIGLGKDATLSSVFLSVNRGHDITVRNLALESPVDWFTSWDPTDGANGNWNGRFKAMGVVTGTNIWVDHCTFSDGAYPDDEAPTGFQGRTIQRHDGLLDIEDGSDFITVSYSQFLGHDKTMLIGSGDSHADRDAGHLKITYHHNLFKNALERSPRVRFGAVHTYNNLFQGAVDDPHFPMLSQALGGPAYFLGTGYQSKIYSEYNDVEYTGPGATNDIAIMNFGGNQFVDHGSWFNGRPTDLNTLAAQKFDAAKAAALESAAATGTAAPDWTALDFTTDVGWSPAHEYKYHALTSPAAVRAVVLAQAGAGR